MRGGEFKDGEGIDPIVDGWGKEESFVVKVLLNFVEVVLRTGANCCGHIFLNFKRYVHNIDTFAKKFKKSTNFFSWQ